jgi:hypothetical protein
MFVKAIERLASMIAPANARPDERPNDPFADVTPAASPTRSSEMGDRVEAAALRRHLLPGGGPSADTRQTGNA